MNEFYRRLFRRFSNPMFLLGLIIFTIFYFLLIKDFLLVKDSKVSILDDPNFFIYMIGAVISVFFMMSQYLNRKSDNSFDNNSTLRDELQELKYILNKERRRKDEFEFKDLFYKIDELNSKISKFKEFELDIQDKKDLYSHIENSIKNEIGQSVIKQINDIYGTSVLEDRKNKELLIDFDDIKQRLKSEIRILTKRANTNLAIGTSLTIVAGITLWVTVVSENISFTQIIDLSSHYIPRLSLIVFIEIFAFFFLKLYKTNLNGTKYYHNELTNVDLQIAALKSALIVKDTKVIENVVNQFSKTERNFIIPKDSTTIELEKIKSDREDKNGLLDLVKSLIKK